MVETNNLVTSSRFDTGFVYQDYISQINVNQDRFDQYYGSAANVLTDDDVDFFKRAVAAGASKVLVLINQLKNQTMKNMVMNSNRQARRKK